jgi:hypothetical protein
MTVGELIKLLQQYDPDNLVECAWEGTRNDIEVYLAADGAVLIDGDRGFYRVQHQKLPCDVCGKQAKQEISGSNFCWEHSK